jgi:hypothetical protein
VSLFLFCEFLLHHFVLLFLRETLLERMLLQESEGSLLPSVIIVAVKVQQCAHVA